MKKIISILFGQAGDSTSLPNEVKWKGKGVGPDLIKYIIQLIIAILTAILTTLGVTSCMGW